jgi:hypothetical protein
LASQSILVEIGFENTFLIPLHAEIISVARLESGFQVFKRRHGSKKNQRGK